MTSPLTSTSQFSLTWKFDTRGSERWNRSRLTQLRTSVSKCDSRSRIASFGRKSLQLKASNAY